MTLVPCLAMLDPRSSPPPERGNYCAKNALRDMTLAIRRPAREPSCNQTDISKKMEGGQLDELSPLSSLSPFHGGGS
jgi:hypothetical protein